MKPNQRLEFKTSVNIVLFDNFVHKTYKKKIFNL